MTFSKELFLNDGWPCLKNVRVFYKLPTISKDRRLESNDDITQHCQHMRDCKKEKQQLDNFKDFNIYFQNPFYDHRFHTNFESISMPVLQDDFDTALQIMKNIRGLHIYDFLHILKNFRSRLLYSKVVINHQSITDCIEYDYLIKDEFLNP